MTKSNFSKFKWILWIQNDLKKEDDSANVVGDDGLPSILKQAMMQKIKQIDVNDYHTLLFKTKLIFYPKKQAVERMRESELTAAKQWEQPEED